MKEFISSININHSPDFINSAAYVAYSKGVYDRFTRGKPTLVVSAEIPINYHIERDYYEEGINFVNFIKEKFPNDKIEVFGSGHGLLTIMSERFVIFNSIMFAYNAHVHNLTISGDREICDWFFENYKTPKTPKTSQLCWWYTGKDGGSYNNTFPIITSGLAQDCFYPWIDKPLIQFYQEYINSSASILLLMGEPGTGKTTFLRDFLVKNNISSYYTFDEKIMLSDKFYIDFISSTNYKTLVIEDADILLSSRETNNSIMSKFLNVADGIIKIPDKKIIFTTNLDKTSNIDSALIREGRCHDILNFRKLSLSEANVIAKESKIPLLEDDKEYTLAEVFNGIKKSKSKRFQKIGFGI